MFEEGVTGDGAPRVLLSRQRGGDMDRYLAHDLGVETIEDYVHAHTPYQFLKEALLTAETPAALAEQLYDQWYVEKDRGEQLKTGEYGEIQVFNLPNGNAWILTTAQDIQGVFTLPQEDLDAFYRAWARKTQE